MERSRRGSSLAVGREGTCAHEERFKQYGDRLDADVVAMIRDGFKMPGSEYASAKQYVAECRTTAANLYKTTPVVPVPAPGMASTLTHRVAMYNIAMDER